MLDQSSCDPSALFHFCQEELKRGEQLGQAQTNLGQALGRLLATCADFRSSEYAEHLIGPLRAHAERIDQLSAWVDTVAQDFVRADSVAEQPFFVAPLQQTLPINLDDATPDEPPAGPIPLPTLGPIHAPSDPSFFVAPLQQTGAINLDDAIVYPTLPPPSNARFKLFENQPRDMDDLALLINNRYRNPNQSEDQQRGPIGITQIGQNRYLVTLVGIEWDTDMETNRLRNAIVDQATPLNSDYFNIVQKTIRANIPTGSELVLAAHSHGGIVAQNLAGDSWFTQNEWPMYNGWLDDASDEYIVTDVITFGSPVAQWPNHTIEYHMYAVADDVVPTLRVVHPADSVAMELSGKFHGLPKAPEGKDAHSLETYAQFLKENDLLNKLSFTIDEWGPTYTFAADYWHNDGAELAPFPQEER